MSCIFVDVYPRFVGVWCLHVQERNCPKTEAGRNVGNCLPVDTESSQQTMLACACVLPIAMQSAIQTTEFCIRTAVATSGDVADSTEVRKWKCLFVMTVNAATECFNPCQNVTNASLCLGIMLKGNDVSVGQMSCI
jgi:hypothetical protein